MLANESAIDEDADEDETLPLSVTIPMGLAMACLIIFAIIGNLLTIISYIRDRNLRTVYNTFILNLAITDLLIGCLSMGVYSSYDLASYHWFFGYHVCKIWLVIDFTICLESVLIIFLLSMDRFMLLKMGPTYNQKLTMKKAVIAIVISWIVAFLLYGPAIIGYDIWTGSYPVEEGDCDVSFVNDVIYTSVTAIVEFLVPFIGIAIINTMIYIEIRKRMSKKNAVKTFSVKSDIMTQESSARRDIRAAKFLAALVCLFAVTWAPYTITTVIISFSDHVLVSDHVYELLTWVNWSKASINPFLYAFNSARFRKNFQDIVCCCKMGKGNKVGQIDYEKTMNTISWWDQWSRNF